MRRCSSGVSSPPVAALALLLLVYFSHCAAAARPLPAAAAAAAVPALAVHQKNGVKAAASADGLALQEGAAGNGDELSISELMGAEVEEEAACEEGNENGDECLQRRLLRDAHLDYIYTQHKGKP